MRSPDVKKNAFFEKPGFSFAANVARKKNNGGRFKPQLSPRTPNVNDEDIQARIKKYKLKTKAVDANDNRGLTKDNLNDYLFGPKNAIMKLKKRKGEVIDPEKDLLADGISSNILKLCIEAMSRNANNMSE